MYLNKTKKAFTLIEILVGILITSSILIIGFSSISSILLGKTKLIESTSISKETFFFTQKLFEEIKKGGLIDYEEYFNRSVVGIGSFMSGHYLTPTGFGNFGEDGVVGTDTYGNNFYYCRSNNGTLMGTGGCVTTYNTNPDFNSGNPYNYKTNKSPQRYGQYSFQFIDYNSNKDSDLGDEDGDLNIIGDDDDEYIGNGPEVFANNTDLKELYLISGDKTKRTLFRWNVKNDPYWINTSDCSSSDGNKTYTGTGCLGTIEFLRLDGKDWGMDHDIGTNDLDGTQYDGVIDTWIINSDFVSGDVVAGSDNNNYRLPLFPDTINVTEFKVYAYPNKDVSKAWKDDSESINVSPYVRLKLKLSPSWKTKRQIKGKVPEFELNTTINLTEFYSR